MLQKYPVFPHLPNSNSIFEYSANATNNINYAAIRASSQKAQRGERLTVEDALNLYASPNLAELGFLADLKNQSKNGKDVFFNVNRHINPTNICTLSCKFCSFSRKENAPGSFTLSMEEIAKSSAEAKQNNATEIHLTAGLHPNWQLANYKEIIQTVKSNHPKASIKAFTAVEILYLAKITGLKIEHILTELQAVGLDSLTGGGAEIFSPRVRELTCPNKPPAEDWLLVHEIAHKSGMQTTSTMLYGHLETIKERVEHLNLLRTLQDKTGGFLVFIPLAFQPQNNSLGIKRPTNGVDDLKTIAVSRLFLDNFTNIKAYWVMLSEKIAQTSFHFGANDMDGTVVEEKIAHMAGAKSEQKITKEHLINIIKKADRIPVERNTKYQPLTRY